MPQLNQVQQLGPEGTINFVLTPIKNGTDRLYLIDIGAELNKNRITLLVTKDQTGRNLTLETYTQNGDFLNISKPFSGFQLGAAYDVELVWSTSAQRIGVFIDEQEFLDLKDSRISFSNLGNVIHFGEDLKNQYQTEIGFE